MKIYDPQDTMPNSYFKFKKFIIHQDKCAMKVGTDGVLLGAWVSAVDSKNILDVGTGTGLITLMLAQRSDALIDAIDIDRNACAQAEINFSSSIWKNRINLSQKSFQDFAKNSQKKYDLIISNPPYFGKSFLPEDLSRAMARHDDSLPLIDLVKLSKQCLRDDGKIALILPVEKQIEFEMLVKEFGFYIHRLTKVVPKQGKKCIRVLSEAGLIKKETKITELTIETEKRHVYTDEFILLVKDFYLKL